MTEQQISKFVVQKPSEPELLLEFLGEVTVPAATSQFVAKDNFVVDTSRNPKVKISGTGFNFDNWFLSGTGQIEGSNVAVTLRYDRLRQPSVDSSIITERGGVKQVITWLPQVYAMMAKQPDGKKGTMLNNGWANIFYVPQAVTRIDDKHFSYADQSGETVPEEIADMRYLFEIAGRWYVLRTVYVYWFDGGWRVSADSVLCPRRWLDGSLVFSRK